MVQDEAVREGARLRFRPVTMTATVAALGLVPFLFGAGSGSEIQRPLAIVVIGGQVSSTALTLLLIPALYAFFEGSAEAKPPVHHGFVQARAEARTSRPRKQGGLKFVNC